MNKLSLYFIEKNSESLDFVKIHGHNKFNYDSPEAFFHNFAKHNVVGSPVQTPGYQHCASNGYKPYSVKHIGDKHGINSEYAKGHGRVGTQWFKFNSKIDNNWYDISSGVKVNRGDVK